MGERSLARSAILMLLSRKHSRAFLIKCHSTQVSKVVNRERDVAKKKIPEHFREFKNTVLSEEH